MFKELVATSFYIYKYGLGGLAKGKPKEDSLIAIGTIALILLTDYVSALAILILAVLLRCVERRIGRGDNEGVRIDRAERGKGNTGIGSDVFVLIVIAIAVLTVATWVLVTNGEGTTGWMEALSYGMSVMLVASGDGLEIAKGVAREQVLRRSKREGIPVENDRALDVLSSTTMAVFDKTGIITVGKPVITDVVSTGEMEEDVILALAAALERDYDHPIAVALWKKINEAGLDAYDATGVEYFPGKGAKGTINSKDFYIGSSRYMAEILGETSWDGNLPMDLERAQRRGKTAVFLCDKEKILGIIIMKDKIKATSVEAITMIGKLDIEAVMLTGDSQATADAVSRQVGVTKTFANLLPEEKEAVIEGFQKEGNVVIMAEADSGVKAADMTISKMDLLAVEKAVKLGETTKKTIRIISILWWIYNVVGILLATGVFYPFFRIRLSPLTAAVSMVLFNLCIMVGAMSLRGKKII